MSDKAKKRRWNAYLLSMFPNSRGLKNEVQRRNRAMDMRVPRPSENNDWRADPQRWLREQAAHDLRDAE